MTEIPEAEHGKEKGIRGLMQIAEQSKDHNTLEQSREIVSRYLAKFKARMIKSKTPLTDVEEDDILSTLTEIIERGT